MKILKYLCILGMVTIIIFSCKKDSTDNSLSNSSIPSSSDTNQNDRHYRSDLEKNFFDLHFATTLINASTERNENDAAFIQDINNVVYQQNIENEFVIEFVDKFDYLAWDAAIAGNLAEDATKHFGAIPILNPDSETVNGLLLASREGDTWQLKYVYRPFLDLAEDDTDGWLIMVRGLFDIFTQNLYSSSANLSGNHNVDSRSGCPECFFYTYGGYCATVSFNQFQPCSPALCCFDDGLTIWIDNTNDDGSTTISGGNNGDDSNLFTTANWKPLDHGGGGPNVNNETPSNPLCEEMVSPNQNGSNDEPITPSTNSNENTAFGDLTLQLNITILYDAILDDIALSASEINFLLANPDLIPPLNIFLNQSSNNNTAEKAVEDYIDLAENNPNLLNAICGAGNPLHILEGLAANGMNSADFPANMAAISKFYELFPDGEGMDMGAFIGNYVTLKEDLDSVFDFSEAEEDWLLMNGEVIQELDVFNSNPNYSETNVKAVVGKAYTTLRMDAASDNDLLEALEALNVDVIPGGDILWDILKEQLAVVLQELIADLVPGGTIITVGPELLENIRSGNWLDAMYNAIDIGLNEADAFLPVAKMASFGFALVDKYNLVKKVFTALKKAKILGQEFVLKLYNVLRSKLGVSTIKDKFRWIDNNNGAKLDDFSPNEFFDDILDEFGVVSPTGFTDFNGHPVFKIGEITQGNLGIYTVLYPDSDTGWNWTVAFYTGPTNANNWNQIKNNEKFKIRFD